MEHVLVKVKGAFLFALPVALAFTLLVSGQDLTACHTSNNQLRLDCTFMQNEPGVKPYCEFLQDDRLLGSTEPGKQVAPNLASQVSVTMEHPNMCRLTVAGISGNTQDNARTYKCRVLPGKAQEKAMALHPVTLIPCSAVTFLFNTPNLLLTVMSLPALLTPLIAY